ncbi:cyclic AMP-dependent transcription factor ATF-6 alpha-like [Dysidea avara]|uniref:cyclic AMP-dependent transcription factor ATF-6 alpha-like n=1 Tax=Dysidea avara TaxID=196820 RepID=UPI00332A9AEF
MEATTVEDLLQDVDLTACLEQSPELEVPLFDDIFDELYLSEELWQDASKISLPSDVVTAAATETKTTEMPANIHQQTQITSTSSIIPNFTGNGLQKVKTEVVYDPSSCVMNKTPPILMNNTTAPVTNPVPPIKMISVDKPGVKRSHPDNPIDMSQLSKRQQKMLKNRQSSSLSRQRKKEYVSTLEAQLSEAAKKNNALIKENEALRVKVKQLEKDNQLLQTSKPQGLLTPPRTPAMLAIVLFVTLGLMFSPIRTMITGSVEYEHSLPVKMHRALLSVEDTAILNDRTPVSRAVGPHLPDQLVPVTAMDNVKSLHKAKKQARKKVVKTGVNVNASDTGRLHTDLRDCFSWHEAHPWYKEAVKTSAVAVVDHELQSVYSQDVLPFPYHNEKAQYFFKKSFTRNLETYYLISFKDHLMLNAPLYNKTQFPKLSVMIPFNQSFLSSEEHLSMMQMDCSVVDAKLLTVKLPPDMS